MNLFSVLKGKSSVWVYSEPNSKSIFESRSIEQLKRQLAILIKKTIMELWVQIILKSWF